MQRSPVPQVATFVVAVTIATAILVAAGLGERTDHAVPASPRATVTAHR